MQEIMCLLLSRPNQPNSSTSYLHRLRLTQAVRRQSQVRHCQGVLAIIEFFPPKSRVFFAHFSYKLPR